MKKKTPARRDPSRPLTKKKELFCQLYTSEHWGDPAEAARLAGYSHGIESARKLFGENMVNARIRYLRRQLADQTIADEAWIKRSFIEIIKDADKPADKLRALAALYRTLTGTKKNDPAPGSDADEEFPFDDEEI